MSADEFVMVRLSVVDIDSFQASESVGQGFEAARMARLAGIFREALAQLEPEPEDEALAESPILAELVSNLPDASDALPSVEVFEKLLAYPYVSSAERHDRECVIYIYRRALEELAEAREQNAHQLAQWRNETLDLRTARDQALERVGELERDLRDSGWAERKRIPLKEAADGT